MPSKKSFVPAKEEKSSSEKELSTRSRVLRSTEIVPLNESLNPSNVSRRDPITSSQSEIASTSGLFSEHLKKRKHAKGILSRDHSVELSAVSSEKSKPPRDSKVKTQRKESLRMPNDPSFLKKTEQVIDYGSSNVRTDTTNSGNAQCEAEMLILGRKSSVEVTTRSNIFSESLIGEIKTDAQRDELVRVENMSQSVILPFQNRENVIKECNESDAEKKKEKKSFRLWAKSYHLHKPQIMGFFVKKKKKKEKGFSRYDFLDLKYLDAPVPCDEDIQTKEFMRSGYFHCLQLIVLTSVALSMMTNEMFYFTDLNTKMFFDTAYGNYTVDNPVNLKTLRNARTFEDFWTYAENTMIKLMYWDFFYYRTDRSKREDDDNRKMFNENQILGVPRIRQVRVGENSCKIHPHVKRFFKSCFDYYSVFSEDVKPIKTDMKGRLTETAWTYSEAAALHSAPYWGVTSIYGGGGYYIDLSPDKETSKKIIAELKENHWVSRATRAIFVEFNIYNANINLFCICKIVVELPPAGGLITTPDFHTLKLIRYLRVFDFFILGCEFVYILFIINNTVHMIQSIRKYRITFLKHGWNYLNVFLLALSYTSVIVNIVRHVYSLKLTEKVDETQEKYIEFDVLKNIQIAFNDMVAILLFFSWVKLFSFLNFTKTMEEFRRIICLSLLRICSFFPFFLTIFVSFVFLGHLLFGYEAKGFESISMSIQTLLYSFIAGLDYKEIQNADKFLGPIFFLAFVFFVMFVLSNVFIAIVTSAFVTVKSQVIPYHPRTGDFLRRGFVNLYRCCRPRRVTSCTKPSIRKKLLLDKIKKALRGAGFTGEEIDIFFHKYDINYKTFLDDELKKKLMKDLELRRIDYAETSEQLQINLLRKRFDDLKFKMESWEHKLPEIIDKVDVLLRKI